MLFRTLLLVFGWRRYLKALKVKEGLQKLLQHDFGKQPIYKLIPLFPWRIHPRSIGNTVEYPEFTIQKNLEVVKEEKGVLLEQNLSMRFPSFSCEKMDNIVETVQECHH